MTPWETGAAATPGGSGRREVVGESIAASRAGAGREPLAADGPNPAVRAYEDAVQSLEDMARHPIDATPPLSGERMRRLLSMRGMPQAGMRVVVVAGTVGKGSTSTMLAALLRAAGMRTGLFTGPHLIRYTERIQVDGADMALAEWTRRVCGALDLARVVASEGDPRRRPSVLEILALVALEAFRDAGVQWAVMEAGVGGFRDYTGGLESCLCVLTEVDLDHTHLLGCSIEEIALEKVGIVRAGTPVIGTCSHPDARRVLEQRCHEIGAPLRLLGRDFEVASVEVDASGGTFDFAFPARSVDWRGLRTGLPGRHQVRNAAGALASALEILGPDGGDDASATASARRRPGLAVDGTEAAVREALPGVRFPGRMELYGSKPPILLDGAHQPAGTRALRAALEEAFPARPVHLVVGVLSDKDREGMASVLGPVVCRVTVTAPPWASRAGDLSPVREAMERHVRPGVPVVTEADCRRALEDACAAATEEGALVCVTGSLYLVGAVREILERGWRPRMASSIDAP